MLFFISLHGMCLQRMPYRKLIYIIFIFNFLIRRRMPIILNRREKNNIEKIGAIFTSVYCIHVQSIRLSVMFAESFFFKQRTRKLDENKVCILESCDRL